MGIVGQRGPSLVSLRKNLFGWLPPHGKEVTPAAVLPRAWQDYFHTRPAVLRRAWQDYFHTRPAVLPRAWQDYFHTRPAVLPRAWQDYLGDYFDRGDTPPAANPQRPGSVRC